MKTKQSYENNFSIPQENCKSKNKEILEYILLTYKCDVCENIPRYPLQKHAKSNNYFCSNCIGSVREILYPSRAEIGLLEHLEVSCFNQGCNEIFTYEKLEDLYNHALKCPKKIKNCLSYLCSSTLVHKIDSVIKSNNELNILVNELKNKNNEIQNSLMEKEIKFKESFETSNKLLRKEITKLKANQLEILKKFNLNNIKIKKKIKLKINKINDRITNLLCKNINSTQNICPNFNNNITHNNTNSKNNVETKIFNSASPQMSPINNKKELIAKDFSVENSISSVEIDTGASFFPILMGHEVFKSLNIKKAVLLYRGSENDFSSAVFHSKCDNKGPTITIVKSEKGNIFGGYSPVMWESSNSWGEDIHKDSFLFSITRSSKHIILNPKFAIDNCAVFGPTFGKGADLYISDQCNLNESSYTEMGDTYESNFKFQTIESRSYLSGSIKYFKVEEYEVYLIY